MRFNISSAGKLNASPEIEHSVHVVESIILTRCVTGGRPAVHHYNPAWGDGENWRLQVRRPGWTLCCCNDLIKKPRGGKSSYTRAIHYLFTATAAVAGPASVIPVLHQKHLQSVYVDALLDRLPHRTRFDEQSVNRAAQMVRTKIARHESKCSGYLKENSIKTTNICPACCSKCVLVSLGCILFLSAFLKEWF